MSHIVIPGESVETVRVPYASLSNLGVLEDPTSATVEIGFSGDRETEPASWNAATWETSEKLRIPVGGTIVESPYKVAILIGTGATDLAIGLHAMWLRVTDSPEVPIRFVSFIEVT